MLQYTGRGWRRRDHRGRVREGLHEAQEELQPGRKGHLHEEEGQSEACHTSGQALILLEGDTLIKKITVLEKPWRD